MTEDWQMTFMTLETWLDGAPDLIARYCEETGAEAPDTSAIRALVDWLRAEMAGMEAREIADDDLPF